MRLTGDEKASAGNSAVPARAEAEPKAGLARFHTFASLRYRDYRLLWFGSLFATAGNWIQQVTLGWLIYDMTGSAFLVGTLQGARASYTPG